MIIFMSCLKSAVGNLKSLACKYMMMLKMSLKLFHPVRENCTKLLSSSNNYRAFFLKCPVLYFMYMAENQVQRIRRDASNPVSRQMKIKNYKNEN